MLAFQDQNQSFRSISKDTNVIKIYLKFSRQNIVLIPRIVSHVVTYSYSRFNNTVDEIWTNIDNIFRITKIIERSQFQRN